MREWLLEWKESFLLGFVGFVLLTLLCLVTLGGKQMHQLANKEVELKSQAYFTALVESSEGLLGIIEKMRNLPGVTTVELLNDDKVESELKSLEAELGSELLDGLKNLKTLKIVLSQGIHPDTAALVKEYFTRLAGNKAVSFSKVKAPGKKSASESKTTISLWSRYVEYWALAIISIAWLFVIRLGAKELKRKAFIIERFQRKKFVSIKLYAIGWSVPVLTSLLLYAFLAPDESLSFVFRVWPAVFVGGLGALLFARPTVRKADL